MAHWFYYDNNGTKQGPINDHQLKALVQRSIIKSDTRIESSTGQQTTADKIKGLNFPGNMADSNPFDSSVSNGSSSKLVVPPSVEPPSSSPEIYGVPNESGFGESASTGPGSNQSVPPLIDDLFNSAATAETVQAPPNYGSSFSSSQSQTGGTQIPEDTLTNFKARPGLNWIFDLKFNLCFVFTFAKTIVQILYILCLIITALSLLVGPIVTSYPVWSKYSEGRTGLKALYKKQREIKSEIKQIAKLSREKLLEKKEAEIQLEYGSYGLEYELERWKKKSEQELRDGLTNECQSKLTRIEDDIKSAKRYAPSFTIACVWTVFLTFGVWIMALLQLFFARLICEWWIFMLGWLVDTRRASQHIIAGSRP